MSLLTKLDAVNLMLSSIGQTPVNSLDVAGIRDVSIAKLSLDNCTREVLTRGWSFNSDRNYEITPDGAGHFLVPDNVLFIDPTDRHQEFLMRYNDGVQKLYDTVKRTYALGLDVVRVNIIWSLDFEELPQAARQYVATRAARIFQSQVIGSDVLFRYTEQHELESLATLQRLEARQKDRNWFKPKDYVDTNRIADRLFNPGR